jgi:2-polyprenyl-3-methyl-5-hydroxy-6-metoxy-1,4-benzoquinol methylase
MNGTSIVKSTGKGGATYTGGAVEIALTGAEVVAADATLVRCADGGCEITTPVAPWSYAMVLPLGQTEGDGHDVVGLRVELDLEVDSGSIGIFATGATTDAPLGRELMQRAGGGRTRLRIDAGRESSRLWIRSGPHGSAKVKLHQVRRFTRRRFDITDLIDDVLPALVITPGDAAMEAVAAALSERIGSLVLSNEIGALECRRAPIHLPFQQLFTDPAGQVIVHSTESLISLMPTYDPSKMDPLDGYLGREYCAMYLRQSITRVSHLVEQLHARGVTRGSVLEVGSLFGQFALSLQRLGFDATVVDRYRAYDGAFDGYTNFMRTCGVRVIETNRADEHALIATLGQFDVVLCMAVIEHVPDTPRDLLQTLTSHVIPGGVVALDTPNIAGYWNRQRLAQGLSIHQPIENQFFCTIPYEGHHREYTAAEMDWMLQQVGCRRITTSLFDYNLLQYQELSREHVDALLAISLDPTLADTVLVVGTVSAPSAGGSTPGNV